MKYIKTTSKMNLVNKVGSFIRHSGETYYVAWTNSKFVLTLKHQNFANIGMRLFYNKSFVNPKQAGFEPLDIRNINDAYDQLRLVLSEEECAKVVNGLTVPAIFKYKDTDYEPRFDKTGSLIVPDCNYTVNRVMMDGEKHKWVVVAHVGFDSTTMAKENMLCGLLSEDYVINRGYVDSDSVKHYYYARHGSSWVKVGQHSSVAIDIRSACEVMRKLIG